MSMELEQRLAMVSTFDEMTNTQKDYAAQLVANLKGKRIRDIHDVEVLDYHKELAKELFNSKCDEDILNGFVSKQNGHHYRTNRDDQLNFIGQYLMLKENYEITEVFWKTEDAGQQPVSREVFFMIYAEALMHKNDTIRKYWTKKLEIDACTTHAQVRAIKWEDEEILPQPEPTPEPEPVVPQEPTPEEPEETTPPVEEPVTEPVVEEPVVEEPVHSEPVVEEPVTEEVVLEPEKGDEPLVDPEPVTISSTKFNTWKPSYFTR